MSFDVLDPPFDAPADAAARLRERGYALVRGVDAARMVGTTLDALAALDASWDDLPPDRYLRDGGRYRRRRHSCFVVDAGGPVAVPHRAHWQPVEYNALHGGMQRWFEPVTPAVATSVAWRRLLDGLGAVFSAVRPVDRWSVEAHQFRIDTEGGIGRPTPEGAHRDGVDFVAVVLVARRGVKGGETRVFDAAGPGGRRFTLTDPWSMLLMDDARVIHETTPIQPVDPTTRGIRDTLVVTYRAAGFQGDDGSAA